MFITKFKSWTNVLLCLLYKHVKMYALWIIQGAKAGPQLCPPATTADSGVAAAENTAQSSSANERSQATNAAEQQGNYKLKIVVRFDI